MLLPEPVAEDIPNRPARSSAVTKSLPPRKEVQLKAGHWLRADLHLLPSLHHVQQHHGKHKAPHNALPTLWSQLKWGGRHPNLKLNLGCDAQHQKNRTIMTCTCARLMKSRLALFFFQVLCFTQSLPQPRHSLLAWLSEIPAQINPRRCKQQTPKISSISRHRHGRLSRPIPEVRAGQ